MGGNQERKPELSLSVWSLEGGALSPSDLFERCSERMLAIESSLRTALPLQSSVEARQAPDWASALRRPQVSFYEANALSFNQVFFRKNFLKCLIAMSRTDLWATTNYVGADLGCGAGPMSLAALTGSRPIHLLLVDASAAQLALARRILGPYGSAQTASFFQSEIPAKLNVGCDVIAMASYWASEARIEPAEVSSLLLKHRRFLIVDDPGYISALRDALSPETVLQSDQLRFSVGGDRADLIEGRGGQFGFIFGRGRHAGQDIL